MSLYDAPRLLTAVLGPTNTGKTHLAVDRMLARKTGVIGFPLRLLAREIYDRIVKMRGPSQVALVTGEEKIVPATAKYYVCTTESMPLDWGADFLAVDEIQLCADPERGHIFTDRLLNARGLQETMFLGSMSMRERIGDLVQGVTFVHRERLSTLSYVGPKKIARLPPRSAIVAFSAESVYAIAELLRRQKGGAAVVMGAMSPRTRNAQVEMFQNGEVDYLVATDAIGMGLNLDIHHIYFAGLEKFDGRRHRPLTAPELAQIAGRAGRHVNDGGFGVTGEARDLDEETIRAIEEHRVEPIRQVWWRNTRLEYGSPAALLKSLEAPPPARGLMRVQGAEDEEALRLLLREPEVIEKAQGRPRVKLLWDVCQIPDFRKSMASEHAALLGRIYAFLTGGGGVIPLDWIAAQIERIDRIDGDIDALSKRLAYIRTWTYVAHRADWLAEPGYWREKTREVEDRLSDALHARLTQRFVDRRTSLLMRRLKQKETLMASVEKDGSVMVEGAFVGRIEGLRFTPDKAAEGEQLKTLLAASADPVRAELTQRVERLYNAPDNAIDFTEQGGLVWDNVVIGRLTKGAAIDAPGVKLFVDDFLEPVSAERAERRLQHWIERRIATLFEPLAALKNDEAVTGLARGLAFQLSENLGVLPRMGQAGLNVKQLDQDGRGQLRKHGVRFGQHTVFAPALLKPAPIRLRLALWGVFNDLPEIPAPPPAGVVTFPAKPGASPTYYAMAGYRLAGTRAIRIDMLERLADLIRGQDAQAGFEASGDMLSITGLTMDQFIELMAGLNYVAETVQRPKKKPAPAAAAAPAAAPAPAPAEGEASAPEAPAPEAPAAEAAPEAPAEMESVQVFRYVPRPRPAPRPERGPRPYGDRPQGDRPQGERPPRREDRPQGEGRPPRREPRPEGAPAPAGAAEGRPPRENRENRENRPPRRDDRPQGERPPREERPRPEGGDFKPRPPRSEAPAAAPQTASQARPPRPDRPEGERRGPRPEGQGRPPRRDDRGREDRGDRSPREYAAAPPDKQKGPDPDSPFAILQRLKDKS